MEVLRRCPLVIAQRLVHHAIAVSTAVLGQSRKDNVRCTAVEQQPEAKEVQLSQPSSTSLLMISSGLRVQLHLPPLDLAWNPVATIALLFALYSAIFSALEQTHCAHVVCDSESFHGTLRPQKNKAYWGLNE